MALTKLKYNGDSKIIKNLVDRINALIEGGGGASKLVDLTDTNISNPSNGQVLGYNSSSAKWVNMTITVPTKTSDLTNDSGFITSTVNNLTNYYLKTETYTQAEVNALIGAITTVHFEVVQTLPTSDIQTNVIYLVPKSTAGTNDVYDEYINMTGTSAGWELIGSTQVDLSNYYTKSQTDTLLSGKVNDVEVNGTSVVNSQGVAEVTVPDELADLADDSTHRTVTDTEKSTWSAKVSDNPTFTEASSRANIVSGESFATILGKIKKFFTDLKSVAFSGEYADLSGTPTKLSDFTDDVGYLESSDITVTQIQSTGTKIATIDVDGTSTDLYAPTGGGSSVSWSQLQVSGDKIASIIVSGITTDVYTPNSQTFSMAVSRANINSGETYSTIFGKIKKFFNDLKAVAFSGSYNDLTDKPTIPVGSDYVQKSGDTMTGLLKFSIDGFRTYEDWGYDIGDSGNFHHLRNAQWDNWQIQKYDNTEALTYTFERGELTNYGDVIINHKDGTTSAAGTTVLSLGNNIAEGADKNSKGLFRVYSNTAKKTEITAPSLTADRTLSLPDKSGTVALTSDIPTNNNQLTNGAGYITSSESCASAGWSNSANRLHGTDTRNTNEPPSTYMMGNPKGDIVTEFKGRSAIGAPGNSQFGTLITITPWNDSSGTRPVQIYVDSTGQRAIRYATDDSTWGSWESLLTDIVPILRVGSDIPEGATNLSNTATVHRITAYQNGLSIPYQMDNTNDGGILRVRGTSESNCIFEMGTWDDSGEGETIQFNYYPTTSQVTPTYSVTVPKKSGTIALLSDISSGSCNYANSAGSATYATYTGSIGNTAPKSGRDIFYNGVYTYGGYNWPTNAPCQYASYIGFGYGTNGSAEIAVEWTSGNGMWYRALGDWQSWSAWKRVIDSSNIGSQAVDKATKDGDGVEITNRYGSMMFFDGSTLILRNAHGADISSVNLNMSSKRYKHNIQDLTEEEATKILDIHTVTFDFNEQRWGRDRYTYNQKGVIAEEVEKIIPTAVRVEEIEGDIVPKAVDYSEFVPYLIKMVQMQQKEIDELKEVINEIRNH